MTRGVKLLSFFFILSSVIAVGVPLFLDSAESRLPLFLELKLKNSEVACCSFIVILTACCLGHRTRASGWVWLGGTALAVAVFPLIFPSPANAVTVVGLQATPVSVLVLLLCFLGVVVSCYCLIG